MLFATTWKDLEGIILNNVSQREKDKYCIISHIFFLRNKTNKENILVVARGRGLEVGKYVVKRYKLLVITFINHEDIMYSMVTIVNTVFESC